MVEAINSNNTTQCKRCSSILTFDDTDVKEMNQGGYEEYIVKCPICREYIQVCYINGND